MVTLRKRQQEDRVGHLTHAHLELNLGSYVTGGVEIDPRTYAEGTKIVLAVVPPQGSYSFVYDYDTQLLKVIVIATGAELANSTDLSALNIRAFFVLG
jgi:hypothetical protein